MNKKKLTLKKVQIAKINQSMRIKGGAGTITISILLDCKIPTNDPTNNNTTVPTFITVCITFTC